MKEVRLMDDDAFVELLVQMVVDELEARYVVERGRQFCDELELVANAIRGLRNDNVSLLQAPEYARV